MSPNVFPTRIVAHMFVFAIGILCFLRATLKICLCALKNLESGTDVFTSNDWLIAYHLKWAVDLIIGTLLCYDCIKLNRTIFWDTLL